MQFNKFQRILWTINGVFIFSLCLFLGYHAVKQLFPRRYDYSPPEVLVGDQLDKAKKDGLILQRLTHEDPLRLGNSDIFILPVQVSTLKNPKSTAILGYVGNEYFEYSEVSNTINIIFLDDDLVVKKSLLSKKAFISDFRYPKLEGYDHDTSSPDSMKNYLTYEIAFDDSNSDGAINRQDATDLYISSLEGDNLTQVTHGLDVSSYKFITQHRILISYTRRDDPEKEDEHKKEYMSLYFADKKTFDELPSLEKELEDIEKLITQ